MTPTERIERAARAAEDTAVISMGDYEVMNWRAVVRAALTAAYPELFSDPPTAWIAPMDITGGPIAEWIDQFDWQAMRSAHFKEQA